MKRDIHSLSDLVTGTASPGHKPLYHETGGWKTVPDAIDARSYGATGDGSDDLAEILAAITAGNVAGGSNRYSTGGARPVYLPPGVFSVSGLVTIPSFVSLRGAGRQLTTLKATDASAKLSFTGSYGHHGGFTFDGDGLATTGMQCNASSENLWMDIGITDCVTGIHTFNLQNSTMFNVSVYDCSQTGLYVDDGTGSCLFARMELASNLVDQLRLGKTDTVAHGYVDNTNNRFDSLVIEGASATTQNSLVLVESSVQTTFVNCVMAPTTTRPFPAIKMRKIASASGCQIAMDSYNYIQGSPLYHTAFDLDASSIVTWASPAQTISAFLVGYQVALGGKVRGLAPAFGNTTTYFAGTGGATEDNSIWHARQYQELITRLLSTDYIFRAQATGDATQRFRQIVSGKQEWGDGTNAPDTNLYRNTANELKTDDKFVIGTGVGVLRLDPIALPATCAVGELCVDTADKKLKVCTAANTWTIVGSQ